MVYTKIHEVKVFSFSVNDELMAYCTKLGKLNVIDPLSSKEAWSSDVKNPGNVIIGYLLKI